MMLDQFSDSLDYHNNNNKSITFKTQQGSTNDQSNNDLILTTDLSNLVIYLTDPNNINYQFVTNLLITHRIFIESSDLLEVLLDRLQQCFEYVLFDTNKLEQQLSKPEQDEDNNNDGQLEVRFNTIKKILLRTFVIIRNWLLNHFIDDWVENDSLSSMFVNYLNALSLKFENYEKYNMINVFFIKIIVELKKAWINICEKYWNTKSLSQSLIDHGFKSFGGWDKSVIKFIISYKLEYSKRNLNMPTSELYKEMNPTFRNDSILASNDIISNTNILEDHQSTTRHPEPSNKKTLKKKKSIGNLLKNLPLIQGSNSLASLKFNSSQKEFEKEIEMFASKADNQLDHANLFKKSETFGTTEKNHNANEDDVSLMEKGIKYNFTMISPNSEIRLLDFNRYPENEQGQMKDLSIECYQKSDVVLKETVKSEPINEPPLVTKKLKTKQVPLKQLVRKWKRPFRKPKLETRIPDLEVSQIVENLLPEDDIVEKVDMLAVYFIDELDFLTNKERNESSSINKEDSEDHEASFFSNLGLFDSMNDTSANSEGDDDDDDDDDNDDDDWEDETDDGTTSECDMGQRSSNSFLSAAKVDWNNDSLEYQESNSSGDYEHTNILDVTPSMIIDNVTMEVIDRRFSGSISDVNRLSRSSLISKKSYLTYDSKLSRSSSIMVDRSNHQQLKHLTSRVLEKVRSFEKLGVEKHSNIQTTIAPNKSCGNLTIDVITEEFDQNEKPETSLIKPKIDFFQKVSHNDSAITVNSSKGGKSHVTSTNVTSMRQNSMMQSSIFSDVSTVNTIISNHEDDLIYHNVLRSKNGHHNIRELMNDGNECNDTMMVSKHVRSPTLETQDSEALIRNVMEMDSFHIADSSGAADITDSDKKVIIDIDCSPLRTPNLTNNDNSTILAGSTKRDNKSEISMLSVASYLLPGMDNEVMQALAAIPDISFHGQDPISAALSRLEGKNDNDSEELRRKLPNHGKVPESSGNWGILQTKKGEMYTNQESDVSETKEKTIEEQVDDLHINELADHDANGEIAQFHSNFFQPFTPMENIFDNTPDAMKNIVLNNGAELYKKYQKSKNLQTIEELMTGAAHIPFILQFDSYELAEILTMIERDVLLEIDWKELVELQNKETPQNFSSWLQVIVGQHNLTGVDLALSRFNLVVQWVVSEIILTNVMKYRVASIAKFIDIATKCLNMQNYSTMMQIILALTSEKIGNLPNTWDQLDDNSKQQFMILEQFANPMDNFMKIRELNGMAVNGRGMVPFIGLYLYDLQITLSQPSYVGQDHSLIHWKKFNDVSRIVIDLVGKIQYSKLYNRDVKGMNQELLSKCLYIKSLDEQEMDLCVSKMVNP
ncbi:mitotic regulator [Saccharomycopsis crataegensis]|uniref:Mitotic regulator n=1 Tax=Saccharomycopsis crataegensis TaxID=43959 RepID=A0AAV5QLT1_9ASCO|nr:mitotic regulator [Saccharomycopsis crataegensis]